MTPPPNTDRLIKSYLADGPVELPDRSFEAVRDAIDHTRQRPAFGGWSVPRTSASARLVATSALVLIAFVGINLAGLPTDRGVSPTPTPTPTPTPSPTPAPTLIDGGNPPPVVVIEPGTHEMEGFPVRATVDVPAGWYECSPSAVEQSVCLREDNNAVGLMIIESVVADPCATTGEGPPLGPTVDDLAGAIAGLPGFDGTVPVDVTVDGHPGKELTVTAPANPSCNLLTWTGPFRTNGVSPGEVNRIRIVDVDGVRVLIAAAFHPTTLEPDMPAEVEAVFESVRFP